MNQFQQEFQLEPVLVYIVIGFLVVGFAGYVLFKLFGHRLFGPPGPPPAKKKDAKKGASADDR